MRLLLLVACLSVFIVGCAAGPNSAARTPNREGAVAGFWLGFWHGFISPIAFLCSLLTREVHFYEVHNNGGWYNFGFVLGAGILFGGGSETRRRR